MPRFKTPDYGLKMIPVDFQRQVLPIPFHTTPLTCFPGQRDAGNNPSL